MKNILTFILIILFYNTVFSQFNRSYGNVTISSNSYFSNFLHFNESDKTLLTNLYINDNYDLILTTQEIDDEGEVLSVKKHIHNNPLFFNEKNYINSISGIFDKGINRYYVLILENGNGVRLAWLKTNIGSGDLVDIQFSEIGFFPGYMETKLIGSKMVSYLTKGNKLKRLSMSINTFGNLSIEDVVSHGLTTYDMERGKKMGTIFMLNGKEYFVNTQIVNDRNILIYRREGDNQFTKINLYPDYYYETTKGTTVIVNDDNQIVITDGEVFNIIDANGNYIKGIDLEMEITFNSDNNSIFYKDKKYYIIYSANMSGTPKLLILDEEFNKLVERKIRKMIINRTVEHKQKFYLDGIIASHGKHVHTPDSSIIGYISYLESFEDTLKLDAEEYYNTFDFQNCDLNMNIGLGSRAFAYKDYIPGISYKNKQALSRESLDNYVGVDSDNTQFGNSIIYFTGTSELPGPCTKPEDYDEVEEARYNRSYHLNRQMIADHLDSAQNGSKKYIPVREIRNWPGNGNSSKGQAQKLADFVDQNNNGIYEPLKGDYPKIYGDECIFSISHYWDQGNENRKLEFHSYIYHFDCDSTSTFRNVLFRKLNVISRGADLSEFYMGVYQENDIGERSNDYIGTNPDLGMTYFYNGEITDHSVYSEGFNDRLAAAGTMILKGFKAKENGLDDEFGVEENESVNGLGFGDGIVDNEYNGLVYSVPYYGLNDNNNSGGGAPPAYWELSGNYSEWINNFKGLTVDGDLSTYGGLGYGGSVATRYAFPWKHDTYNFSTNGAQAPFENWSETNTDGSGSSNEVGDRKILASFGETSLSPEDMISVDYAFLFARDPEESTSITSSLDLLFEKGDSVRNAFLTNEISCGKNFNSVFIKLPKKKPFITGQLNVFPNPSDGQYKITGISEVNKIRIYGLNGALVKEIKDYQIGEIIDLNHLGQGIYLFHIEDEYQREVKKVLKI